MQRAVATQTRLPLRDYLSSQGKITIYDFHATILGLNHEQLTFYHNGIERRLTDVHGHVIHDVLV